MQPNNTKASQKEQVQYQTLEAINQYDRPKSLGSIPVRLSVLIAIFPAAVTQSLIRHHFSHNMGFAISSIVYLTALIAVGIFLRSLLRKHPDSLKWQLWIR